MVSKVEFVNFDVIQESWDEYKLPDSRTLRFYSLLTMPLKRTHDNGDIEYRLRTSIHYTISKNGALLGINSGGKYPIKQVKESLTESPIKPVAVVKSSDNTYSLRDSKTAYIRTEVVWVQKTSLFSDGISIYYVETRKNDGIK